MQLFQILLYAGRDGIPRGELISRLYEREDLEDAGATLRVNIYRLRKYIQKLNCFENTDCICSRRGSTAGITVRFHWNGIRIFSSQPQKRHWKRRIRIKRWNG